MKTNKDYVVRFKLPGVFDHGVITIPVGTRVTHNTALGPDENYFYVDSFDWVKPYADGTIRHGLLFDLRHYGLNVPREYVDE